MNNELEIIQPQVTYTTKPVAEPETGYYRIKKDSEDQRGFLKDALVYVYAGKDAYHVFIGEWEWKYEYDERDEFDEYFELVPNGAELRQKEITSLMNEIASTDLNMIETQKKLTGLNPHIENGEFSTGSDLVPAGSNTQTTKKAVAEVRNNTIKVKKELEIKTRKLELMIREQSKALAIKAKEMSEMVAKMEEAIWTINLYLGKNEEIHILRKGAPAPATEKITIRQGVQYMDEECAIAARQGGIDVQTIDEFDEWLLADEKNLNQAIPDKKGIIAFHIKRHEKDYKDPWANVQINQANLRWTYFLIRNGENLYRVYIDMDVGSGLFPDSTEFDDYFTSWQTEWDEPGHPRIKKPLKPGTPEYMKAVDAAEDARKHYLRIGLVVQGLMDRTPIFKPMPTDRINLCDPRHCEEWLNLIYTSEKVITDGRPLFRQWQGTVNDKLEVGHRIIGIFDYESRVRGGKYETCRIYPERAAYPASNVLHVIEDRESEKYIFRYHRKGDTVYRRDTWLSGKERFGDSEVRARCWVEKGDNFFLNFDEVTIEEMEYYINHRLSRVSYKSMVPLLDAAIKLKKEEIEEEKPFRLLLIGQIMARYSVSNEAAEEKVDTLIKWWKFKNRNHRALLSEDTKALSMILDEFGHRQKQESVRQKVESVKESIIAIIGAQNPAPVLIAHKSDNKYVAYVPHNQKNIWVIEQLWTYNRTTGVIGLKESKEWKLVDKRHERWEIIYKHTRWDSWLINPPMGDVLTDPELQQIVVNASNKIKSRLDKRTQDNLDRTDSDWPDYREKAKKAVYDRFMPLCFYYNDDFELTFWYSDVSAIIPSEKVISSESHPPSVARMKVGWKRTKDGVDMGYLGDESHYCYSPDSPPWFKDYFDKEVSYTIVQKWDDNISLLADEFKLHGRHKELVRELRHMYDYVEPLVAQKMKDTILAKVRKEFDDEFGDPELWQDHLEGLKLRYPSPAHLESALNFMAERHINVVGWTLGQLYEKVAEMGFFEGRTVWNGKRHESASIPSDVPMDFVIPMPPPKEESAVSDE